MVCVQPATRRTTLNNRPHLERQSAFSLINQVSLWCKWHEVVSSHHYTTQIINIDVL